MIESEMRTDSANWLDLGIKTNPTMTNASNRRETNTTTITTDMTENNNTRKSMHLGTQESHGVRGGQARQQREYWSIREHVMNDRANGVNTMAQRG